MNDSSADLRPAEKPAVMKTFDPALVSEALWSQWRETVKSHNIGQEKLGRLAPTLQALPTVIWHKPLSDYVNYTVAEIRQLRTTAKSAWGWCSKCSTSSMKSWPTRLPITI